MTSSPWNSLYGINRNRFCFESVPLVYGQLLIVISFYIHQALEEGKREVTIHCFQAMPAAMLSGNSLVNIVPNLDQIYKLPLQPFSESVKPLRGAVRRDRIHSRFSTCNSRKPVLTKSKHNFVAESSNRSFWLLIERLLKAPSTSLITDDWPRQSASQFSVICEKEPTISKNQNGG